MKKIYWAQKTYDVTSVNEVSMLFMFNIFCYSTSQFIITGIMVAGRGISNHFKK